MKKITLLLFTFLLGLNSAWSHALWLETKSTGEIGQEQEIKVFFGEYTYGVYETVNEKAFNKVKQFTVWVIDPKGNKEILKTTPKNNHYSVKYTPKQTGTYTIELDNDKIDVVDYTAYDFGIIKTHYHSTATFTVGKKKSITNGSNKNGFVIQDISTNDSLRLKIEYKGKILKDAEVEIAISDQWTKKCYTDSKGEIVLDLPWKVNYFIEVSKKENVPGKYKGVAYESIWHCATYMTKK